MTPPAIAHPRNLPKHLAVSSGIPCRKCGKKDLLWEQWNYRWRAACNGCQKFYGYGRDINPKAKTK